MKHRKTFRIDKLFGLATLVCLLVITLMVYNDFFKDTVSEGNVIGKETESETRTSGYLNDNKNVESKGASSKAVVCLDPSKGGKDTGVSSSGRKEKDINLEMALDIKSKLESDGIEVVMTRTSDRDVTDEERVKICNSSKVYICVSLRMNSYNADTSVSGAESYIHTTKPVTISPHCICLVPKSDTITEAIFCAAPLSATNLPSIAPNTIINVNPPKILPIPLFTESGSFSNGIPKAMPAKIEEIRNAMKASTLK